MGAKRFKVVGMHCAACQAGVEKAVSEVDGVESVSVSLLTNSMEIAGSASEEDIIRAVEAIGFEAEAAGDMIDPESIIDGREITVLKKRLISSVWLLVILMYFSMGHSMLGLPLPQVIEANPASVGFVEMVLATIVLIVNGEFFTGGFRALLRLAPDMDSLVALGSMTSYLWSLFILSRITAAQSAGDMDAAMTFLHQLYFESAAMIVTLITVGKLLEAMSKGRTTDALKGLIELAPRTALVERPAEGEADRYAEGANGDENHLIEVPVEEIRVGDYFVCRAGDSFPVDGEIVDGETSVDESALTGESAPVPKKAGDSVSAATINMSYQVRVKATYVGEDTTLSQIIKMVSEASATKAPIARIADKVSGVFVPAVICIAIFVILIWVVLGSDIGYALARGISVLVISCPCALGLATPVAIMAGTGVGAKKGLLFKTARSLEQTGKAGVVAFDKTGTITEGDMISDRIRPDSAKAIAELKALGIGTLMLTGDKPDVAGRIGREVGIDDIASALMPQDKEEVIRSLMGKTPVVMVGDGINDAPALTAADVGIAIGAGRDVAIDAADVVIMNSSLSDVTAAVRLSRATLRTIHQNLFWAFFYNILLIPLAAGVYTGLLHGWTLNPMIAAAAMSLSSFCVCMNALRLNLFDPHDPSADKPLRTRTRGNQSGKQKGADDIIGEVD